VRGCCETSRGPCTVWLARSDEIDAVMQLCDDAAQWLVDQGVVQWKPGWRFPVPRGVYFPQVWQVSENVVLTKPPVRLRVASPSAPLPCIGAVKVGRLWPYQTIWSVNAFLVF
jgi:hypothetical protein